MWRILKFDLWLVYEFKGTSLGYLISFLLNKMISYPSKQNLNVIKE